MSALLLILLAAMLVAAVVIVKRRKRSHLEPVVASPSEKPTENTFLPPNIQLIHASDAQQHLGELKSILMRMKAENRITDFTAQDVSISPDTINFKNEDRQHIIVMLTNGLGQVRSAIESSLKNTIQESTNIKLIEIIVDNLPYHTDFISLPKDLIPIRSRVGMDAIWNDIELDLHIMFPKHEKPKPPPPEPEKTGNLRGVVKGFQQRFEIERFHNKPKVVWTFRLDCYENGRLMKTIPVQMVGDRFEGDINDGDEVEIPSWRKGTVLKTNRVKNWTTGIEVRSSSGNALQALGCLIFLLGLAFIAFLIFNSGIKL